MFDTMTADVEIQSWLDGADSGDVELIAAVEESERLIPHEPSLPADLAGLEPGIVLAGLLASIDIQTLSGRDRVTVMAAHQRMASHFQAQVYASMVSVADAVSEQLNRDGETDLELVEDACSSEIRAALRLTRRAADAELAIARDFQFRLPAVWEQFVLGRIDRRRANLIVHRTDHLPVEQARQVADQALEGAPELTTGQLTALLRKLCVEADPVEAKKRYETAVEERRVVLDSSVDGTAHLYLMDLPPDRAVRIRNHVDAIARSLRTSGESRTMDQLRADVVLDLLDPNTVEPHRKIGRGDRRGGLVMTVDLATLVGLEETSGDLAGFGPVIADIARQITETSVESEWRYLVTDHDRRPLHTGITRRRPTAQVQRMVETMVPTCVFPGCRMPATQSDLDHTTAWADGGPTCPCNLAPLCRHDHCLKHGAGWSYTRTEDGDHLWTSPLGHHYLTKARGP